MKDEDLVLRICGDCNGPFYAGPSAQYCPNCRKKRHSAAGQKSADVRNLGKKTSKSRRKGKTK